MVGHTFISYSKKDSGFAYKLADDLTASGFTIWIDRSIGGGEDWREDIEKNLKAAGDVIVVVSQNSMASDWVRHEGSLAYGWEKHLIPVLIENVAALPPWLEEYQWIDFVNKPYDFAYTDLVKALTPPNPVQELLEQQLNAYRQTGELIGETVLRAIEEERETLEIDVEAKAVLFRSSVAYQSKGQPWLDMISENERQQVITEIDRENRLGDRKTRQKNSPVLWALRKDLPARLKFPLYVSKGWQFVVPRLKPIFWILLPLVALSLLAYTKNIQDTGWRSMDTALKPQNPIVAVHPDFPEFVFAVDEADGKLFRFERSKKNWIEILDPPWKGQSVQALSILTDALFVATNDQIFYLQMDGADWQYTDVSNSQMFKDAIVSLAASPALPEVLFAATKSGVYVTTDTGENWQLLALDDNAVGEEVRTVTFNGDVLLVTTDRQMWMTKLETDPIYIDGWRPLQLIGYEEKCSSVSVDELRNLTINSFEETSESISFVALFGDAIICDGGILDQEAVVLDLAIENADLLPSEGILSLTASGRDLYVGSKNGIYCRRIWEFPQFGWWLWFLRLGPCS